MDRPPFVSTAGVVVFCVGAAICIAAAFREDAVIARERRAYNAEQMQLGREHELRVIAAQRGCVCADAPKAAP